MSVDLLPKFVRENYEIHEWKHACAILKEDFPNEWQDIISVLTAFRLQKGWITNPGGRKSKISDFIVRSKVKTTGFSRSDLSLKPFARVGKRDGLSIR